MNCDTSTDSVIDARLTLVDTPLDIAATIWAKPGFMPLPKIVPPPCFAAASTAVRARSVRFRPVRNSALVTMFTPARKIRCTSPVSKCSGV